MHARTPTRLAIPLVVFAALGLGACGSFTPAGARPGGIDASIPRMPPDFALSMSLHPATQRPRDDGAGPTPAWYMVEPDGRLRAAAGARGARTPVPPIIRQLSHAEVRELWSTVRASGLSPGSASVLGDTSSARAGTKDLPTHPLDHPIAIVFVAAEGERRTFEIDLDGTDAPALGAHDLAARLRQLAGLGK